MVRKVEVAIMAIILLCCSVGNTQEGKTVPDRISCDGFGEAINSQERGEILLYLGRYEEAIEYFDLAIQIFPAECVAVAYYNRGIAKDELGRYQEAIADYDQTIQLDPKHADAYYNRRIAKDKLGRYQEAIADYDQTIQLDPKHADAYYNRGL